MDAVAAIFEPIAWRMARDERIGGICTRDEFIRMYQDAGGVKVNPDALLFWEVFSNVKFAVIFITGTKSIVQGKTADIVLALTAFINPSLEVETEDVRAVHPIATLHSGRRLRDRARSRTSPAPRRWRPRPGAPPSRPPC